jgi:hypothetical protein
MRKPTITIDGESMTLYHVGIGYMDRVYFNRTTKEAIAYPKEHGRRPVSVLLEAIFKDDDPPEPKFIEITNQETWRKAMHKFRQ